MWSFLEATVDRRRSQYKVEVLDFWRRVKGRISNTSESAYRESSNKTSKEGVEQPVSRERERAGVERDEKDRARTGVGKKRRSPGAIILSARSGSRGSAPSTSWLNPHVLLPSATLT